MRRPQQRSAGHWLRRGLGLAALALLLLPAGCEDDDDGEDGLVVHPASSKIAAGDTDGLILEAEGGAPPYYWLVADANMGAIAVADATAIYTRTAAVGLSFVFVTDSASNTVTATINQL